MIHICKHCQIEFETLIQKKVSCSRKCSMAWRQKNVYKNEYSFKHRSANPRNFLRSLSKKISDKRNLNIDFLFDLYIKQDGKCFLSGRDMTFISGKGRIPTNISIDRIDSKVGYEENNIQLVCIQANKMKAELNLEELTDWCLDIIEINKRKKK